MKFWFDMDGTIADLYGVDNWLEYLMAEDTTPYDEARALLNLSQLARKLNKLQELGHEIGIISWMAKNKSELYDGQVRLSKLCWLHKHLKSVTWDHIEIVPHGTSKISICGEGILFDDEEPNRMEWGLDSAFTPDCIFDILDGFLKGE